MSIIVYHPGFCVYTKDPSESVWATRGVAYSEEEGLQLLKELAIEKIGELITCDDKDCACDQPKNKPEPALFTDIKKKIQGVTTWTQFSDVLEKFGEAHKMQFDFGLNELTIDVERCKKRTFESIENGQAIQQEATSLFCSVSFNNSNGYPFVQTLGPFSSTKEALGELVDFAICELCGSRTVEDEHKEVFQQLQQAGTDGNSSGVFRCFSKIEQLMPDRYVRYNIFTTKSQDGDNNKETSIRKKQKMPKTIVSNY